MFYELTWIIGILNALATSDAYLVDLESIGRVVYPIWLFVMIWMVPFIWNLGTRLNSIDSNTIPCAQIAASPWTWMFSTSSSLWPIILDLAFPIDTGFWAYRWEGLCTIVILVYFPSYDFLMLWATWETASSTTVKSSIGVSHLPLIFLKSSEAGYYKTFTKVFSLPLWGIPKTISLNPFLAPDSKSCSRATTVLSAPSPEYLLNVTNFLCRKWSSPSASTRVFPIFSFLSFEMSASIRFSRVSYSHSFSWLV